LAALVLWAFVTQGISKDQSSFGQGNYDVMLAVDPTNPNIAYLGGTNDFQLQPASGLIRIDSTNLFDPHNTVPFDNNESDGGALMRGTNGGIVVKTDTGGVKFDDYGLITTLTPYVNLLTDPLNPFLSNSTLLFTHVASFTNEGSEAIWCPFDAISGTTDLHRVVAMKDPLTGHARLIFGDDQGVYTVVDRGDGTFTTGIGPAASVNGPRSGNLQITQFYYGAAQPSNLAAQIGAALFYGNAQDDGFPVSDPNILNDGSIGWSGPEGDGTGIATDQTGSGTAYSYQWPCCGTNPTTTDFFLVAPNGPGYISRTGTASGFSLVQQNQPGPVPDPRNTRETYIGAITTWAASNQKMRLTRGSACYSCSPSRTIFVGVESQPDQITVEGLVDEENKCPFTAPIRLPSPWLLSSSDRP
jgi:large repetitive protein